MVEVGTASVRVIRYGVIVQIPCHSPLGLAKHLPFAQNTPHATRPVRERSYAQSKLLPAGSSLHLEVPLLGLTTVVREAQKGKLLWLLTLLACIFTRKSAKFYAAGLCKRQFQPKTLQPVLLSVHKVLCICLVLKAGQIIIGKTKIVCLTPALLLEPATEPQVQHIVKVDV